jgi:glucosylceramidase
VTLKRSAFGLSLASLIVACSSSTTGGPAGAGGGTGSGAPGGGSGGAGSGAAPSTGGASPGGSGNGGSANAGGAGGAPTAGGAGGAPNAGGAGGTPGTGGTGGEPPVIVEKIPLVTSGQGTACAPTLDGCTYWRTDGALTDSTANADVTVSDTTKQVFTGFGGSFNEEGWQVLSQLTPAEQTKALELLFGADGAHFVYGRIPIGASDYAVAPRYSLQESSTAAFTIERDKQLLIPYINAAKGVSSSIHFWGSPWSPPPWMKDNNEFDGGNMKDDAGVLSAFATYLANFVQFYGQEGITIEAIHPQNEPGYSQSYPSCGWPGNLMGKFIGQYLGPKFQELGITAEIFIGTMSNPTSDATLLQGVMNDATAKPYIKGYGLQWGMLSVYGNLGLDPSLKIWQTEHKCGNYPFGGQTLPPGIPGSIAAHKNPAPNDHAYAEESWGYIREWIKNGVNSYSAWNMVLDSVGVGEIDTTRIWAQNALLTVDTGAKKLNLTPTYFVFRHVSQYVDPGATRLDTTGGDALAFKNLDGSITTIIYNSGAAKDFTVAVAGKKVGFAMPARGWATVNVKP